MSGELFPPQVSIGGRALDVQVTERAHDFEVRIFEHTKRTKAQEPVTQGIAPVSGAVEMVIAELATRADKILRARETRRQKIQG